MKRVFIVHRWDGEPDGDWYPWLAEQLEDRGFKTEVLTMPNPEFPEIKSWVSAIKKAVGKPDENTYFVGHSIGCQAIMRYLSGLPAEARIGGSVFVAGWFGLMGLETEEEAATAKSWLETPIDLNKVRTTGGRFAAVFSDNDPFVPLEDAEIFRKMLGAQIVIEKYAGHFAGVEELPAALAAVLEITG